MNLNKAMIIGNLTRDPELRNTPNGTPVATFSVATNMIWKDQSGQRQEKVEYHNIVTWRKLAEICSQYLRKGSKVYVEGRIQTRDWMGQDNVKRYRTEIIADNLIMLDRANAGGGAPFSRGSDMPLPQEQPMSEPVINIDDQLESGDNPAEEEIRVENIPF